MSPSAAAEPAAFRARYDAVVVGGGPGGSTLAQLLARSGYEVLMLERERHPRFRIGESLLPATLPLWRRLGVIERFERAGFLRKYGAYFCDASGRDPELVSFARASRRVPVHAYEVRRADFDQILWQAAVEAGAHGVEATRVSRVLFEAGRAVGVLVDGPGGEEVRVEARLVADCSGRDTLVGRQLGLRERDPELTPLALYCHYDDVLRSTGEDAGTLAIVGTRFGWMWFIPFSGGGASVGAVIDRETYAGWSRAGGGHEEIWDRVLAEVPAVARRLAGAERVRPVEAAADFQYHLRELAGDGWVAIGDAAAFLDPIFSTGVHLAMTGAERAHRAAARALAGGRRPVAGDFSGYVRRTRSEQDVFARLIRAWYEPACRQVLSRAPEPRPGAAWLKREIVSVLAGAASPAWRALPAIEILLWLARRQELAAGTGDATGAGAA